MMRIRSKKVRISPQHP